MSDQTPTQGPGASGSGAPGTPVPGTPVGAPPVQSPPHAEVPAPTPGVTPPAATPGGAVSGTPDPVTGSAPAATPQPGAPGGTPPVAAAPTGQPPAGGSSFKGKQKIISMVIAGTAVVGGLGALAGLVGGGDDKKTQTEAPGEAASGVLNPSPIGNVDPQPGATETTGPAEPTTPAEPTAAPPPTPAPGGGVSVGGLVDVPLPAGWEVLGQGDADLLLQGADSSWVYALVGVEDPSADAAALVTQGVQELLTTENYTQLQIGTPAALQPFGSLVSLAFVDYEALWADAQSSIPLHGQLFVAVRQDGTTLVMTAEHSPPEEFDASRAEWGPIIDGAFNAFGAS